MEHDRTSPQGPRADLVHGWTRLWNGDLDQAGRVCAPAVRVHFGGRAVAATGDHVGTGQDVANLVREFRSTRPGLTYAVVEARTTDEWGYCVWNASMGDLRVGGIDTFTFGEAGITHVHSVTAERPMTLPGATSAESAGRP